MFIRILQTSSASHFGGGGVQGFQKRPFWSNGISRKKRKKKKKRKWEWPKVYKIHTANQE